MQSHPKGVRARVLLSSVFGPYAQDDEFGSRSINPMELYHNQVTRAQGAFSLRMFHRSWGIMMIQANISAPTTVLDFPTREVFERELRDHDYDIVGITSIIVNIGKVREMCRIVREISPRSTVVVGGHVTAIPAIASGFGHRVMGLKLPFKLGSTAATVVPSVGCSMGCNFCTTSAFFGGKGKVHNFYNTGEELYRVMSEMEGKLGVSSFFVMDENFLLNKRRAMELLAYMKRGGKSWEFYVFSSANAIAKYTMDELVELGISWVWMGLESPKSGYSKLDGVDTLAMTGELRQHGIRVLGSTIVGMEHHTPENIGEEIEHAIAHDTDFHQFMLYTPVPGTPLYHQMQREDRLVEGDLADIHGQFKFNFRHPAISRDQSKEFLDWAFRRDFERNGPSLFRVCKTTLQGWRRYKNHPDLRIRRRFCHEARALKWSYSGLLWAMERILRPTNERVARQIRVLRDEVRREFGFTSMLSERLLGPLLLATAKREGRRLARGITYEPKAIIERTNWVGNADSAVLPDSTGSVFQTDYAVTGRSSIRPPSIAASGSSTFPILR